MLVRLILWVELQYLEHKSACYVILFFSSSCSAVTRLHYLPEVLVQHIRNPVTQIHGQERGLVQEKLAEEIRFL